MKKVTLMMVMLVLAMSVGAQVTTIPSTLTKGYTGEVTIIFNPNQGNGGMKNATACYAHTGLITSASTSDSDWKYCVNTSWRDASAKTQMTKDKDGNWRLTMTSISAFYGCPSTTDIRKLAFVFNDGKSGSKEGKTADGGNINVDVVEEGSLNFKVTCSANKYANEGESLTFTCTTGKLADYTFKCNGAVVATQSATMSHTFTATMGLGEVVYVVKAVATDESKFDSLRIKLYGYPEPKVEARPAGVDMGIYYTDRTTVTFCTYAAHCKTAGDRSQLVHEKNVFIVGDFNNWKISTDYQCKRDGNYFWFTLKNQPPRVERAFQYAVIRSDGKIKYLTDLYSEKVLCQDDQYEPKTVDPTLMSYPNKTDGGYVSVYECDKNRSYNWSEATKNFKRPDKNNLIIYELWVYDYTPERSYKGLIKRLDYLQDLGINCIELMPVNEFDGNYNWGYAPNHFLALDKAYGTPNDLKDFVDACHQRGIAVVLDMVFNHATGNNPMNKLYPYGADLAYNPWFNVDPPHKAEDGGNTYFEDWNHDFEPTKTMFKRALKYWLEEYKVDGFRMDLSHGFCGTNKNTRYNNLKEYQSVVNTTSPGAYFIQEYWGWDPAKSTIINDGMLCWTGNELNERYGQLAMGYNDNSSLENANKDGYIAYNESHDEERNFYKVAKYGNGNLQTDRKARLSRIAAVMGFNTLLNGSHMIYQYGELGYDWSIEYNGRTGTKPRIESLGWLNKDSIRMQQFQRVAKMIQLRTRLLPTVFAGNPTASNINGTLVRSVQWGSDVYVAANFEASANQAITLPSGSWYDYLDGGGKANSTVVLSPGQIKVFTGTPMAAPIIPDSYNLLAAGVEEVIAPTQEQVTKVYENGQIYIIRNGVKYDMVGRRIEDF